MTSFIPDKAGIHIQGSQIKEIILKSAIENGISIFVFFIWASSCLEGRRRP